MGETHRQRTFIGTDIPSSQYTPASSIGAKIDTVRAWIVSLPSKRAYPDTRP